MSPRLARHALALLVLSFCPSLHAEPAPPVQPVRATWAEDRLVVETDEAWMLAELSIPGRGGEPFVLGPSFPGARWLLEVEEGWERVRLEWVTPDGAGVSTNLPIDSPVEAP